MVIPDEETPYFERFNSLPNAIELEGGQYGAKGRSCFKDLKYGGGEAFQPGVSGFELEAEQN